MFYLELDIVTGFHRIVRDTNTLAHELSNFTIRYNDIHFQGEQNLCASFIPT